jgi:SanA protein
MNRFFKSFIVALSAAIVSTVGVISIVQLSNLGRIHSVETAPTAPVAIVLGASVLSSGEPSDALRDRILTGVDLYRAGKVQSLFMTGDDGAFHVDEISVMVRTAEEAGVPSEAIKTDGHGYRTYESCKRATKEFGITSAIVITQRFHLGRALYLCRGFGMDAQGVTADRQSYIRIRWFWVRDLLSSAKAFWDIHVIPPASPIGN